MSMSRRALRIVQKSLPQLRLCKDVLVVPPTEHIVRGYRFERTPYKGLFYLWRVVMPMYVPVRLDPIVLTYSNRIPNRGDYVELSKDTPEVTASAVTRIIADDLPRAEKLGTPEEFFYHISRMINYESQHVRLDLALTYYLLDRVDLALGLLEPLELELRDWLVWMNKTAKSEPLSRGDATWLDISTKQHAVAQDLVTRMRSQPSSVSELIAAWERASVAALDLAETVSNATDPA